MIKTTLKPLGYIPTAQKDLPKSSHSKYYTSVSCYGEKGIASIRIVRTIVGILKIANTVAREYRDR